VRGAIATPVQIRKSTTIGMNLADSLADPVVRVIVVVVQERVNRF